MLAATALGDAELVNDFVPGLQQLATTPAAVAATPTTRVVVFEGRGPIDRDGVFFDLTDATGATTISAARANATVGGDQSDAQVASFADGGFIVVWSGRGPGDDHGVFFRRFGADGAAIDAEDRLVNTTVGGQQQHATVAVADDGGFTIAWSGAGADDSSGVFLQRYGADGAPVGDEARVNTTTADHQTRPSLAYDAAGGFTVAWQSLGQDGDEWGVYAQAFDASGAATGDETRLTTTTASSQMEVQLAAQPAGGLVAVWQSRGQDGDDFGIVARAFDAALAATTDEIVLNDGTAGVQRDPTIAIDSAGQWLAAWSSGVNGSRDGWEVLAREFSATGVADGAETGVSLAGENSGHQQTGALAFAGDDAWLAWSGDGPADRRNGVYAQSIDIGPPPQQAPDLAVIDDTTATVGQELVITVTATDPNPDDTLTYTLDPSQSPTGATITRVDNNTATIRWTPAAADQDTVVPIRVLVTDDGTPPLADSEFFKVTVGTAPLVIDVTGDTQPGFDSTAEFVAGDGPATVATASLQVEGGDGSDITGATARIVGAADQAAETLSVSTLDTAIAASFDSSNQTLTLSGADTAENYSRVLRTLSYSNAASAPAGDRTIELTVADTAGSTAATSQIDLTIVAPDLVAFAQALATTTTRFLGAAWDEDSTAQLELLEDGGQFAPFEDVSTLDRQLNDVAGGLGVTEFGTWVFPDDTQAVGPLSLEEISQRSGVAIPTSDQPFLAPLDDGDGVAGQTLLVGSPLHVPLDGYDPNGGVLTYSVSSDNPDVSATILTGNRSARMEVAGYGDMVFELFEGRADRATDRIIELAGTDFFDGTIFHRVVDNFVIQGGDEDGDGVGGSSLPDYDDQFDVTLQHNRSGLLSSAKTSDDTNNSQFFVTETPTRNLDFQHTIYGILVEGDATREGISEVQRLRQLPEGDPDRDTGQISGDRPVFEVTLENVDIFTDTENAVLLLEATNGATGTANITVTVTDEDGNTTEQVMTLTLAPDTVDPFSNGNPFFADIGPITSPRNTASVTQLPVIDAEGDGVDFDVTLLTGVAATVDLSDSGVLTVTPPNDFAGAISLEVAVGPVGADFNDRFGPGETVVDRQVIVVDFT